MSSRNLNVTVVYHWLRQECEAQPRSRSRCNCYNRGSEKEFLDLGHRFCFGINNIFRIEQLAVACCTKVVMFCFVQFVFSSAFVQLAVKMLF